MPERPSRKIGRSRAVVPSMSRLTAPIPTAMRGNGWLSGRILARLHDDERGFTLLESLLAITVILGSVLSLAYSAIVGFSYEDLARQKQTATGIADQVMEQVRGLE